MISSNRTRPYPLITSLLLLAGLVWFSTPRMQAADEKGSLFSSLNVPASLSKEEVHSIIVTTISGRGWEVRSKEDGKIVGYLKHRSNEATVTLNYTKEKIEIFCVGWEINKAGERKKPELPTGWLKYIQSDLTKRMNQKTAQK